MVEKCKLKEQETLAPMLFFFGHSRDKYCEDLSRKIYGIELEKNIWAETFADIESIQ